MAVERGVILLTEREIEEIDAVGVIVRIAYEMRTWPAPVVSRTLYEMRQSGEKGVMLADAIRVLMESRR